MALCFMRIPRAIFFLFEKQKAALNFLLIKMLRNVIIITTSGLVLFSKEFVDSLSQPRLLGSLMTALIEFSNKVTGMPVGYIELTNSKWIARYYI